MFAALTTIVFIHKRQRLRRYQALREYYYEQMEYVMHIFFYTPIIVCANRKCPRITSFRRSIVALHAAAADRYGSEKDL